VLQSHSIQRQTERPAVKGYVRAVTSTRQVHAPGRVNLIGDHTDYTGGLVFPMAIDRGTTIEFEPDDATVTLRSDADHDPVGLDLPFSGDPATVTPRWGSYVAAMAAELGATSGIRGHITSTIPAGAGLSSSAALECAIGLALGFQGSPVELAQAAQRAEHAATGVPTGIMDQLCIASAVRGTATLIDCHTLAVSHVTVPDDVEIVVRLIAHRTLVGSAYADRVAECRLAESVLGPLRTSTPDAVEAAALGDVARRRARHVVTENQRVLDFAGVLMVESHRSLASDFDTSTPAMDRAVDDLVRSPGVFGARMTGGGFGGCVVALCRPGALDDGWVVSASAGAREL
jgi:galactokinase